MAVQKTNTRRESGDLDALRDAAEKQLELGQEFSDVHAQADALNALGLVQEKHSDLLAARTLLYRSTQLYGEIGDTRWAGERTDRTQSC